MLFLIKFKHDTTSYIQELLKLESDFLALLPFDSKLPLLNFDWQGMSTGEKAYLNLFSRIHYGLNLLERHPKIKDSKKIYFLIDEPSTGFHPQWQKEREYYHSNQSTPRQSPRNHLQKSLYHSF